MFSKPPSHLNVTRTDIFNGDDVCDICDSWDVQKPVSIILVRAVPAVQMMLTGLEKHPGRELYFNDFCSLRQTSPSKSITIQPSQVSAE